MTKLFVYGLVAWLTLMVAAVINAGARENLYGPRMPDLRAHQLSTILFVLVIFIVTYIFLKLGNFDASVGQLVMLGLIWFGLTISFEFLAGHFLFGNSWEKLFADYNLLNGRLWIFVLLGVTTAPWLVDKFLD